MEEGYELDQGKYWAAGLATSVVAGAAGLVMFMIAQAIFKADLMVPAKLGGERLIELAPWSVFRNGVVAGIVAAGLLWLLLLIVPGATKFFGWIAGLFVIAAAILPFTFEVDTEDQLWLAAINLITGLVVIILLLGTVPKVVRMTEVPGLEPPKPTP